MAGSKGAPRPRSTRYRRFSLAVLGCPSRKFSGLTSPCTYLRAPRAAGHDARPSRPRPPPHPAAHRQEAGRRARRAGAAHPLRCSFSRMDSASTAMQDTISCDITCPCEFHTSQRLGPSMSITCARARARARPPPRPPPPRGRAPPPAQAPWPPSGACRKPSASTACARSRVRPRAAKPKMRHRGTSLGSRPPVPSSGCAGLRRRTAGQQGPWVRAPRRSYGERERASPQAAQAHWWACRRGHSAERGQGHAIT